MQILRASNEAPSHLGPSVVTVGNFDGVHLGHRFLLHRIAERARSLRVRSVAVTFDPHPMQVLRHGRAPVLITPSLDERLALIAATGIDAALVIPFTPAFAESSAEGFVTEILIRHLGAVEVHEGTNFRFGHKAQGNIAALERLGEKFGFGAFAYAALQVHGLPASSSLIRKLVAGGDVRRARWLLGRPFAIHSTPARGRGIGHRLTVPTINLAAYDGLVPGAGVYITRMRVGDACFDSVTNIGTRPTFADASFAIETHLLDFHPIPIEPATPLEVTFLARLRDERAWPSPGALREQIGRDVAAARRYLRSVPRPQ